VTGVRRALDLLVTHVLRSRVVLALALAVVVLGVVGVARLVAGPAESGASLGGAPSRPLVTVDATAGDDGVAAAVPRPSVSVSPGAATPESVARAFAMAWLNHRGVSAERWHADLRPHCTSSLAGKLAGVDPAIVPADRLTGDPVLIPQADGLVDVTIAVDSGKLRLRLVAPAGRWLVDGVDWERA
jgi:hypothetical protein